jgi:hypothetical protein
MFFELTLLPGAHLSHLAYPMKRRVNVAKLAHMFLFEPVDVQDGVKLIDLMKLMVLCPQLVGVYHRHYAKEFVTEIAKGPLSKARIEKMDKEVDALRLVEIKAEVHRDTWTQQLSTRLSFSGIGLPPKEDPFYDNARDIPIEYSLSATPIREILHLPLKINKEVVEIEDDHHSKGWGKKIGRHTVEGFTLGELLQTVMERISCHGGPVESQEFVELIHKRINEANEMMGKGLAQPSAKKKALKGVLLDDMPMFVNLDKPGIKLLFETVGNTKRSALHSAMREVEDMDPMWPALKKAFKGAVVVKPEYRKMGAREFRRAFSEARRTAPLRTSHK